MGPGMILLGTIAAAALIVIVLLAILMPFKLRERRFREEEMQRILKGK